MGDGPPLVLIHGTPFSAQVWRRIAPHLAAHRRVYFYDLLGYGQSYKAPPHKTQDVSLGIQNRILMELIDHWGLDAPDVIAHDFGGTTALRAHLLDKADFNRMILMDAVVFAPWGTPFVQHVRKHHGAFADMPSALHEGLLNTYIDSASHRGLSREALEVYTAPWRGDVGQAAFYRQIAQMDDAYTEEIVPALDTVRCPVSVLWGRQDGWLPPEQACRLAETTADGTPEWIESGGHLVQDDAPEAVLAHVLPLLNRSSRAA